MTEIRKEPCSSCPYRKDVASGVWAFEEYEKLREYDAYTADQPLQAFACHATPEHYCHGWAVVHMNRGGNPEDPLARHPYDLMALRLAASFGTWSREVPPPAVPLFASGNEAADHGQRDIAVPSDAARATVDRLTRKYPRLRRDES